MSELVIEWVRPDLYPLQEKALFGPERFAIVESTTKGGKTLGALLWITEEMLTVGEGDYWWVAPAHSQAAMAYRRLKAMLPDDLIESTNESEPSMRLINGAVLWFRSGDRSDLLFGWDIRAFVIDEASRCSETVWHAVRSTVTATGGRGRLIGNVSMRRDWCWRLAREVERGQHPDWTFTRITWKDAVAAGIMPETEILEAKRSLPGPTFTALYEAVLTEDAMSIFRTDAVKIIDDVPETWMAARGWDLAATTSARSDYSAGVLIGVGEDGFCVLDVVRGRWEPNGLLATIADVARHDGYEIVTLIEQEKGSSGLILSESIRRQIEDIGGRVESAPITGDKTTRAIPFAGAVSSGKVSLLRGPWNPDFLHELESFPMGHDDQVDAGAYAFNWLSPYERRESVIGSVFVPGITDPRR
jgi:predicted phage terminase large subunit-like protein